MTPREQLAAWNFAVLAWRACSDRAYHGSGKAAWQVYVLAVARLGSLASPATVADGGSA